MKPLFFKAVIAVAASSFVTNTWALEYSFNLTSSTLEADAVTEYTAANALFAVLQLRGSFRPGDLIDFTYSDGAIAQFTLPLEGSICTGGKCVWPSTMHFANGNIPKIIRPPGKGAAIAPPPGKGAIAAANAVSASGWFPSGVGPISPIPITVPGYPQPVGWLWGHGVVTMGPVTATDPNTGTTSIVPVTVIDPTTGMAVTTTGSVDLVGGGSFILTIMPADGSAATAISAGGAPGQSNPPDVDIQKVIRDLSVAPQLPPPIYCRPACPAQ